MKEKFVARVPHIFTEIHQKFQEHYWLYGSTTLAGIAAGMFIVNRLVEHPDVMERSHDQIPAEQDIPEEIAA